MGELLTPTVRDLPGSPPVSGSPFTLRGESVHAAPKTSPPRDCSASAAQNSDTAFFSIIRLTDVHGGLIGKWRTAVLGTQRALRQRFFRPIRGSRGNGEAVDAEAAGLSARRRGGKCEGATSWSPLHLRKPLIDGFPTVRPPGVLSITTSMNRLHRACPA